MRRRRDKFAMEQNDSFDVIFIGFELPDIDGVETARRLPMLLKRTNSGHFRRA